MEKFDLESFPTSESAKKMLSYVSDGFYDESYVGKWIFQVMGIEYDKVVEIVTDLSAQFFPETATWGLMYHEIKWGLPVRTNLSYEERRRLIYQRRDYRAPMTPYHMEEMIKTVTLFQVHVIDAHDSSFSIESPLMDISHPNKFKIVLEGDRNADIKKIRELVDKIKQSHTVYDLLYLENAHFEVPVRYAKAVHFRTGFYPQVNLPRLRLDGSWTLDGGRKFSGYNSRELVDLYPVLARFQASLSGRPDEGTQIRLQTDAGEETAFGSQELFSVRLDAACDSSSGQGVAIRAGAAETVEKRTGLRLTEQVQNHFGDRTALSMAVLAECKAMPAENAGVRLSAVYTPEAGDITVYNKNRLESKWKLNGSRKLNGGTELR